MNKITMLSEDLKKQAKVDQEMGTNAFENTELTEEEKEKLAQMARATQTMVVEQGINGEKVSTPVSEYASTLDKRIMEVTNPMTGATEILKSVNKGEINKTLEQAREEGRQSAIKAFKSLARTDNDEEVTEEDYIAINNQTLEAIQAYFHLDRLDTDTVLNKMKKMTIEEMCDFLPEKFVNVYVHPDDITGNTYRAKERILSAIGYMTVTGPEMDYLNEYIDGEHKLMEVTHRLMQCQVDLLDMIKDQKKLSEIVSRAADICPPDDSVWAKYINKGDTHLVGNQFAQQTVICQEYKKAYEAVLEQYRGDPKSEELIQAEIDECDAKCQAYSDVTHLELFKSVWENMAQQYMTDKRTSFKYLEKEAVAAVDRARRSKLNISFPAYSEDLAKKPQEIYKLYMKQFPEAILAYNNTLTSVKEKHEDAAADTSVNPVHLDGIEDTVTADYFSMLLLIPFARILKKCTRVDATKYDIILADAYYRLFCQMCGDLYLTADIWQICKPLVEHGIKNWPAPRRKR